MQPINPTHPAVIVADIGSVMLIVGAWMSLIPSLAALAALVWYLVQIWESKTVVGWRRKREQHRESLKRLRDKGLVEIKHADVSG